MVVFNTMMLVFTCVITTLFPVAYALVPWYETMYGRAMMFNAIALALVMDFTLVARLSYPYTDFEVLSFQIVEFLVFALVALAVLNKLRLFYKTYYKVYTENHTKETTR